MTKLKIRVFLFVLLVAMFLPIGTAKTPKCFYFGMLDGVYTVQSEPDMRLNEYCRLERVTVGDWLTWRE